MVGDDVQHQFLRGTCIQLGDHKPPTVDIKIDRVVSRDESTWLQGVKGGSFDSIYAPHFLEHAHSVERAIQNWARILRSGGGFYGTVPDYLYYEKGTWPSRYDPSHRQSFSMDVMRIQVNNRPSHWHIEQDLRPLMEANGLQLDLIRLDLSELDWNKFTEDQTRTGAICVLTFGGRKQ